MGALVLAIVAAVVGGEVLLVRWSIARAEVKLFGRRLGIPQAEPTPGTGVERDVRSSGPHSGAAVLPRSHPTSAGAIDPRPAAPAGLNIPAGVALIPASREVLLPGALPSAALAGLQPPVGPTDLPPVPTGGRQRVVVHGW